MSQPDGTRGVAIQVRESEWELIKELGSKLQNKPPVLTEVYDGPISIAATARAMLRYTLEHEDDFLLWVKNYEGR